MILDYFSEWPQHLFSYQKLSGIVTPSHPKRDTLKLIEIIQLSLSPIVLLLLHVPLLSDNGICISLHLAICHR